LWFKVVEISGIFEIFEIQHTALEAGPCHVANVH